MSNTDDALYSLNKYFKEGKNDVVYYASQELTNEQKLLLEKVANLAMVNKNAAVFFETISADGRIVFDPKIGISKREFDILQDIFIYKEANERKGVIEIKREKEYFEMQSNGKIKIFDSLRINTKDSIAVYGKYELKPPRDSFELSYDIIPPGETLDSIQFLTGPSGIGGLINFNGKYELSVGKLKPSGRTYLFFYVKPPVGQSINNPLPSYCTMIIEKKSE